MSGYLLNSHSFLSLRKIVPFRFNFDKRLPTLNTFFCSSCSLGRYSIIKSLIFLRGSDLCYLRSFLTASLEIGRCFWTRSRTTAIVNSNGVIRHRKEYVFLPDKHCMNSISLRVNHLDVNHSVDKEWVAILLGRFLSFEVIITVSECYFFFFLFKIHCPSDMYFSICSLRGWRSCSITFQTSSGSTW